MSSWAFGSEYGPKTVQDTLEIARENSRRAPVAFVPGKRDPARGIPAVIEMIANDLQLRRVDFTLFAEIFQQPLDQVWFKLATRPVMACAACSRLKRCRRCS